MNSETSPLHETVSAIVVMGVAGCGKTSVAAAVAAQLDGCLIEGDAFHPRANIEKMRAGIPLDDADRVDWLDRLVVELSQSHLRGELPILACSALKRSYRDRLRKAVPTLGFIFLCLSPEAAVMRVASRNNHFMPATLIASQFADLEPPLDEALCLTVDAALPLAEVAKVATQWYRAGSPTHMAG